MSDHPSPHILATELLPFADPAGWTFQHQFVTADAAKSPVLVEVLITGEDDSGKAVSITASTTVQVVNVELGIVLGIDGPLQVVEKDTRTFTFSVRNLTNLTGQPIPLYNLKAYNLNEPLAGGGYQEVGSLFTLSDRNTVWNGSFSDVIEPDQI